MPTRILREGIMTSEKVNALSERAELFYRKMMSVVDDYGRYFAHPTLIRAACYALRLDSVSESDVKQMLSECISLGLIVVYGNGKHLFITNFKQQTRSPSKFPEPIENELLINSKSIVHQPLMPMCSESKAESKAESRESSPRSGFQKPSLDDVKKQCELIGLPVSEAESFWNFYDSKGWKVGKVLMVSWKSALGGWFNRWKKENPIQVNGQKVNPDVFKASGNGKYTLERAPKLEEFSSQESFETILKIYTTWKQKRLVEKEKTK